MLGSPHWTFPISAANLRRGGSILLAIAALLGSAGANGQTAPTDLKPSAGDGNNTGATLFPHAADGAYWISGQVNIVAQGHPAFHALYTGDQSLQRHREGAVSYIATLFTGFRLTTTTEAIVDVEMAGGSGISSAFGLGGFTNLDVVRNPTLSHEPYVGRLLLHQMLPIGGDRQDVTRGPMQVAARAPARRIDFWAGKLGTVDFFDRNAVGTDSHLQFLNWAVDNNGAYDYAADTRGYTYGLVVAYESPRLAARVGVMLMPKVANGAIFDWDVGHARGQNLEVEWRYRLRGQPGTLRGLSFLNQARMGSYRQAIDSFQTDASCRAAFEAAQGRTLPGPVIECHRAEGRLKLGFGLNAEQAFGSQVRAFARIGWNDGRNESFAYTEVDSTVAVGLDVLGAAWRRPLDRVGLAGVSNGLSADHREFLGRGGKGFLLGDGALTYGRELIAESYYTALIGRGVSLAADVQAIKNPGYNRDRGPVWVGALRLHLEL